MKKFDHDEHMKEKYFWNRNCVNIDTTSKQKWYVNPYPNITSNDTIIVNNKETEHENDTTKKQPNIMRRIYRFLFL